ncbi:hypothetical protein HYV50_05265 [Candidatus Pacearchaeota archaeon]|nr:hypothetical protein [Candidatus Pacearchaeota archaeon]
MTISILAVLWLTISLIKKIVEKEFHSSFKGGIIGILVLAGAVLILGFAFAIMEEGSCFALTGFSGGSFEACFAFSFILGIISLIPSIIIGAIIGWIVGKIKTGKKNN